MDGPPVVRRFGEVRVVEAAAKSALNRVRGMGFTWSLNPYAGCFHQCVFCYARGTHAYRELDGVREWGSVLTVKVNVAEALRRDLAARTYRGEEIAIGTATDPYQALEGRYRLMRGVLAALRDARAPFHITTRSPLIVRDLELLAACARRTDVGVAVSIATLDESLAREIEPTVAPTRQRLRAVCALATAGVRVGVAVAPVLPDLTDSDESLRRVVQAAANAGASHVWHNALNLGDVTRDAYFAYLRERRPELVERYERLFRRGRYAEPAYPRDVTQRFHAICRSVRFARYRAPQRDESGRQLTLI
ncbi:MAG TPA: radical SAM protein [Candidatus Baltobacteraceae bacterium]|nr:radical SAM protein [Candidatus Baltobacteraceae bacterium]